MNHRLSFILCGALVVGPSATIVAAPVIDQSQNNVVDVVANFNTADLAQSFQQANDNIAGAGIYVALSTVPPSMATISVWDALPNQPGALMLATGSTLIVPGGFVDVFWPPVAITPGVTHYLTFASPGSAYDLLGKLNDASAYPLGNAYANLGYVSFPQHDFAFRTYYEPVPEPAALVLAGAAGVLASGTGRRFTRTRARSHPGT